MIHTNSSKPLDMNGSGNFHPILEPNQLILLQLERPLLSMSYVGYQFKLYVKGVWSSGETKSKNSARGGKKDKEYPPVILGQVFNIVLT